MVISLHLLLQAWAFNKSKAASMLFCALHLLSLLSLLFTLFGTILGGLAGALLGREIDRGSARCR